jgi:hypothetical protein
MGPWWQWAGFLFPVVVFGWLVFFVPWWVSALGAVFVVAYPTALFTLMRKPMAMYERGINTATQFVPWNDLLGYSFSGPLLDLI